MTPQESDDELACRAHNDDSTAFDQLLVQHRPRLLRLLAGLIWEADDAESATQETLARAWERRCDYRIGSSFWHWLAGIGMNVGRETLRRKLKHARTFDPVEFAQHASVRRGALSGVLNRELNEQLHKAIDELPLPLREVFVLHEIEKFAFEDIAEMTGVSPGTLRVRASRARALLRDALGPIADTWLLEFSKKKL